MSTTDAMKKVAVSGDQTSVDQPAATPQFLTDLLRGYNCRYIPMLSGSIA